VWVGDIELSDPTEVVAVGPQTEAHYDRARILVRLHGVPLGFLQVRLPESGVDAERVVAAAFRDLRSPIDRHLERDGLSVPVGVPSEGLPGGESCADAGSGWREPLTVVLSTRDRPAQLAGCLPPLKQLRYDTFEVVVIDNAPSNDETARCFEEVVGDDPRFRYVMEPRPGLSRARNRGLAEATHEYVAFTDDDVLVDPLWLDGIARGFGRGPKVGCVTGLVPSAQLDTVSQRYFDQRVWWSSGIEPHVYDLASREGESRLFPFDAGKIGTGANFAVDRELMRRLGGFDERLGAGSPTLGGEDLDAFVRVLRAGRSVVYEPSAMVWHIHRSALEELHPHMYGYGVGLGAFVAKLLADPETRGEMLGRLPYSAVHMLRLWGRPDDGGGSRPSLILAEARGMVAGPFAYSKARRAGW
jgi:GT2 family glycosyltransferase